MTHAVIFDLDGTLVDSLDDIADALNSALADCNRTPVDRDSVRAWIGDGLPALCRRAWPEARENQSQELVIKAKSHYAAGCLRKTHVYHNIMKTIMLLTEQKSPLGVLTNKPHEFAMRIVEGLGLVRYFDVVRGYQSENEKKPAPEPAQRMARAWGRATANILLVGDSEADIQTARNAGMIAVAVTWGFRNREELLRAAPDFLIDDPLEIVPLALNLKSE